jgi:hypothetical protein
LVPPAFPGGSWTQPIIHSFGNPNIKDDGQYPGANVVIDNAGVIYGITGSGGIQNAGEIYSLAPPAEPGGDWTYTILYDAPTYVGTGPSQLTLGGDGVLYSTIPHGGPSLFGTVFSLTLPASPGGSWNETTLYTFTGGSGADPSGGLLIGSSGVLFGTTAGRDPTFSKVGSVFMLTP